MVSELFTKIWYSNAQVQSIKERYNFIRRSSWMVSLFCAHCIEIIILDDRAR